MKTKQLNSLACATLAGLSSYLQSLAATLNVGDSAPSLQPGKWVQGEPVKKFEPGKVYVVEFWATWCGPCRVSIPHLNELHTRLKDRGVIVIGQDVWEDDGDAVAPFVRKMGSQMTYRVALDTSEGKMAQTWMEAAGQNGIPTAFVVNKEGKIAWIDHPAGLKEEFLQQVLNGTFDLKKATADYAKAQKDRDLTQTLWQQYDRAMYSEQWTQADDALSQIEKLLPEDERDGLDSRRLDLLLERGDSARALALAKKMSNSHPENAMLQNNIA